VAPADLVLGFHVAAVRETFEEAGLLLATAPGGVLPDPASPACTAARRALADREADLDWAAWLTEQDLVLDLDRLAYLSRWVTPAQEPKRYDTAFFLARAPEGQVPAHDRTEVTDQRWVTAADALAAHHRGELHLIYPTVKTLEQLAGSASIDEAFAAARGQERIRSIQPHLEHGPDGWRVLHPDEEGYPHHLYAEGA
jgi:8-oxo-dGTP pyrophosphatase MutT (NUDIX family)